MREFIALMAMLMSIVALSIDAILPALGPIAKDFTLADPNDVQLVVSSLLLGLGLGLTLYGPLSDAIGRKKTIYLGTSIFIVGSVLSIFSTSFEQMLLGRVLQGFGGAGCRITTLAMVRDRFSGKEMGRIMSLIMIIFILVPAIAPSVGQMILLISDWRGIFSLFILMGLISLIWMSFRQKETLAHEKRIKFSLANIYLGTKETLSHPISRGYMVATGLIFGALVGYLSTAQQIFQVQYGVGELFPIYFGSLALGVGLSSFLNSKLVMKFSMEGLCVAALLTISIISVGFYFYIRGNGGHPPLGVLVGFLLVNFFSFGILFGNFNAMALEPLGHIAGIANSVIGSFQTLLSVVIGGVVGQAYDGSVTSLVLGFVFCSVTSLVVVTYTIKANPPVEATIVEK